MSKEEKLLTTSFRLSPSILRRIRIHKAKTGKTLTQIATDAFVALLSSEKESRQ